MTSSLIKSMNIKHATISLCIKKKFNMLIIDKQYLDYQLLFFLI